jgi:hypothetical protein
MIDQEIRPRPNLTRLIGRAVVPRPPPSQFRKLSRIVPKTIGDDRPQQRPRRSIVGEKKHIREGVAPVGGSNRSISECTALTPIAIPRFSKIVSTRGGGPCVFECDCQCVFHVTARQVSQTEAGHARAWL